MIYRFGDCELDTDRYELRVNGELKALEPQVFHLLEVLIENQDRTLSRDELIDTVWEGRMVSDSTLASRIKSARQAIGDSGERQAFIQTVHGRGYRFAGLSAAASAAPLESSPEPDTSPSITTRLSAFVAASRDRVRSLTIFGAWPRAWGLLLLLVIGVGAGIGVWRWQGSNAVSQSTGPTAIAVLPFADMSETGDQAYFADGVAEEILNALAKVEGLKVVGRTSSFSFRGKNADVKLIGEQLNVTAVLEGSIRRAQDRVRITTQLVDTTSGYHLWSETYDRSMQDIFAIQDDIARAVVQRLNPTMQAQTPAHRLVTQETRDAEAYRLYLQGRYLWKRRYDDNLPNAIQFFNESIARDPNFAPAHSALAATYAVLPIYTKANRDASFETAEHTARTAIRLNSALAEPYAVLGFLYSHRLEWHQAEQAFQHAIARAPVEPIIHLWYGSHTLRTGRLNKALAQFEKALAFDPAWGLAVCLHSEALYALGQRDAAIKRTQQAVALGYFACQIQLRNMAYEAGDLDTATQHHIEYKRLRGASEDKLKKARQFYETNVGLSGNQRAFIQKSEHLLQAGKLSSYAAFYRFYHAKEIDRAMALFDIHTEPRFINLLRKIWNPHGRPVRTHPRFAAIAAKLNLIPYWREFGWPEHCSPDPTHGVQCQ